MKSYLLEALEIRQLLTTLPTGFTETHVTRVPTNVSATMAFTPDGRLYVGDTTNGQIRLVKGGALQATPALVLPDGVDGDKERGINGLAFAPNFASAPSGQKYVYIYYTKADPANPNTTPNNAKNRLSRFTMSTGDADLIDPDSEAVLIDNIGSDSGVHNGGMLRFGADGKLYVAIGDNGTSVSANAQNLANLHGKVLRLDVSGVSGDVTDPATLIPADNPFVDTPGARGEIWAYGLRNPFTGDIKPGTNTLYVNDVGASTWEEVNVIKKGANYGWPTAEGPTPSVNFSDPLHAYNHNGAHAAITGAAFYSGSMFPASYNDKFFFGDYILKTIWTVNPAGTTATFATGTKSVIDLDVSPIDGSLWTLEIGGNIEKITYSAPPPPPPPPPPPGTQTLRAVDDSYVRDGAFASNNFGLATELNVKKYNAGFNREAFLKFNLGSITTIGSAKLRLYGSLSSTDAKNVLVNVLGAANSIWSETTINNGNKPASSGGVLDSETVLDTTKRWYEFDVTSFAKSNAGKLVSFKLGAPNNSLPFAIFNSDEASSFKPELVISATTTAKTLRPTQDAYVHDGANASKNFGSATTLLVKKNATGFNREAYLKFDLSSVAAINSAKLRLFGGLEAAPGKNVRLAIFSVNPSLWSEGALKYSNKPPSGATQLATVTLNNATKSWREWNLTTFLKAEKAAGRSIVSIVIRSLDTTNPIANFASDEAGANQPQLVLT